MVGHADNQDHTDDHDDEFFAIDELSTERITHETESQLTDDIADVGCGVDSATEQERVRGFLDACEATPVSGGQAVNSWSYYRHWGTV